MSPQPYIDNERDVPLAIEGRARQVGTCHMCGQRGPVFEGAVELADGSGGWTYELGWRCVETGDCRKRRQGPMNAAATPQPDAGVGPTPSPSNNDRRGIAGETGYGLSGSEDPGPIQPPEPTPPDAKEADLDWHF